MLRDNGEIVTEDETEENEMLLLEDIKDEEYYCIFLAQVLLVSMCKCTQQVIK